MAWIELRVLKCSASRLAKGREGSRANQHADFNILRVSGFREIR